MGRSGGGWNDGLKVKIRDENLRSDQYCFHYNDVTTAQILVY